MRDSVFRWVEKKADKKAKTPFFFFLRLQASTYAKTSLGVKHVHQNIYNKTIRLHQQFINKFPGSSLFSLTNSFSFKGETKAASAIKLGIPLYCRPILKNPPPIISLQMGNAELLQPAITIPCSTKCLKSGFGLTQELGLLNGSKNNGLYRISLLIPPHLFLYCNLLHSLR